MNICIKHNTYVTEKVVTDTNLNPYSLYSATLTGCCSTTLENTSILSRTLRFSAQPHKAYQCFSFVRKPCFLTVTSYQRVMLTF